MINIRLTLETREGRVGWQMLTKPCWTQNAPMEWDSPDGDDETTSALFEQIEKDAVTDSYEIDGDEWREIDSGTGAEFVLTWVRRGATLESAVDAAVEALTPEGFDDDYEEAVERRDEKIAELEEAIQKIAKAVQAVVITCADDGDDTVVETAVAEALALITPEEN